MTIITQPICDKKLGEQKKPLVGSLPSSPVDAEGAHGANSVRNPWLITLMSSRGRRVNSLTTICVFMAAFLLFSTGIIGGYYLYRQFTHNRLAHFRGWCSVPYRRTAEWPLNNDFSQEVKSLMSAYSSDDEPQRLGLSSQNRLLDQNRFLDEEVDLDVEEEKYSRIEVPNLSDGRRGRFIHDFQFNVTGIVDIEEERCFVMPLNHTLVMRPKSFLDLIEKLRTGYYDLDTEVMRESYRVVTPPITDIKQIGYYVKRECARMPVYKLEKVTSPVFKRDVSSDGQKTVFTEFAGKGISEIQITNLHVATGNKNQ